MLFIKETPVETIIPMAQAIEAVEESLAETSRGNAVVLPRRRIHHANRMLFGVLPGSFKGAMGAYLQTDRDRAIHHETVILYSVDTGEPLIMFQDCAINELRTGAAGGVGAKYLASPHAARVAVIGSEKHAFTQLQAVCTVRSIETVTVFSPTPAHRLRFADRVRAGLEVEAAAADSAEAALEGADIVITATNAQSPVFEGRSLRPGMHVTSIANGDKTRVREEIDHDTIRQAACVCVTSKATVQANESDLFRAVRDGVLNWDKVSELGDVILGNAPGRTAPNEITLFKLQGLGIMDLAVGSRAYEALKDSGSVQRI
ncbi:MAG: ornithine cyclodeaminase family protein [Deltaproteobacteria bacterium]|nr:ornithine cyclodeaminase family protein [Deltaproteobacteria bacterium]